MLGRGQITAKIGFKLAGSFQNHFAEDCPSIQRATSITDNLNERIKTMLKVGLTAFGVLIAWLEVCPLMNGIF